ncbi:MAG: SusC/RagA family TonB-linked outer membrane protein [Bacteroidales bacterium]|nr:SusC/RagA family TonB-linked outer membrane protein [Bacteroidales bacterium]
MLKILIFSFTLLVPYTIVAQDNSKITINARLTDSEGMPIGYAEIRANGSKSALSDATGNFSIKVLPGVPLIIEAADYESLFITDPEKKQDQTISMVKLPYQMKGKDLVNVPFGTLNKQKISGTVSTLDPSEILDYDARQSTAEAIRGRIPGVLGTNNIHAIGDALFVVDGIPTSEIGLVNLNEVEQITVLRDAASKMLYGVQADKGIILITTKKGKPFDNRLNFRVETGTSQPVRYPDYLTAADYKTYYNEALANDSLYGIISVEEFKKNYNRSGVIDSTRSGIDPIKFPDENYYNSKYFRNLTSHFALFGEASGGNENVNYYSSFSWRQNNGLLFLGNGADERHNVFNIRGKVNYKVNDFIRMDMSAMVNYDLDKEPNYVGPDFWDLAATYHPDYFPLLIPSSRVTDPPLLDAAIMVDGDNLLGGTNQYRSNIYGDLFLGGIRSNLNRTLQVKPGLEIDLGGITEGLSARITLAVDLNNNIETFQDNSFAIYETSFPRDTLGQESLVITKLGLNEKEDNKTVGDASMYSRYTYSGVLNYDRIFGDHQVSALAMGYYGFYNITGEYFPQKHLHFGVRGNYMYKNKYIAEFTGVYAGSSRFSPEAKYAFSPGLSIGWIMSEEGFLSGSSFLNFLKLRASWGIINTDQMLTQYYLYKTTINTSTTLNYGNGSSSNRSLRISKLGNSDLTFPKRQELTFGFDAVLAEILHLESSYYISSSIDNIVQRDDYYPDIVGSVYRYENYNSYQTSGLDIGLKIKNKMGDFGYNIGATLVTVSEKVLQIDELPYEDEYLRMKGKPMDAMYGLVFDRFYTEADFDSDGNLTEGLPVPVFGRVTPGDLKYIDLNEDLLINENDRKNIGGVIPDQQLALEVHLKYKGFEFFALGSLELGANSYASGNYYWVDGNDKYSNVVTGRWTPGSNQNATYPRLTSQTSSNNFRNSSFWLYSKDAFTLHAMQISYNINTQKFTWIDRAQIYVRGNNLITISKEKEKLLLNTESAPQMRGIISFGLNASF